MSSRLDNPRANATRTSFISTLSYVDSRQQIVGAIGVIGPTRMNYARIIPLVDYTAQMIGRRIG